MTAPLTSQRARELVGRLAGRKILVVGDVMLDHFLIGGVTRISPEAPVPVVAHERDELRAGGAANVAGNVRALGGEAILVGLTGDDQEAARLARAAERAGLQADGLIADPSRPTTRKLRIVTTRRQQVARVDYEADHEVSGEVEGRLIERAAAARHLEAIVVSDYLKGVVSSGLMQALADMARRERIPLLVDPKIPHLDYYAGATLITPNHHEAELASLVRIRSTADARRAARAIRERTRCVSVIITRGEHGLWVLEGHAGTREGDGIAAEASLPATAREVADVTGAGDTVVAALALGLSAGATLLEAADLANRAAGITVGRFGPAAVTPDEILASFDD